MISPPIRTRFLSLTPTATTTTSIQDAPQHHNTRAGSAITQSTERRDEEQKTHASKPGSSVGASH